MNRYETIREMGRGGQGAAYLVRHKRDRRVLVSKEIQFRQLEPEKRRRALLEAERLKQVQHPNIVGYVEHFEASGALYIITEYADGGTLASAIYGEDRRGAPPMGEDVILRYFTQIAHALHDLHSRNWIHRDVKPPNIFLTLGGDVKLGGLGISTVLPDSTELASTFCGTEDYIAPEVLMRQKYGTKVDVWALGIVLYEMLMQCRPFTGKGHQLQNGIVSMPYPAVRTSYTAELRDVLDRCLMKDPVARPDIATLLALPIVRCGVAIPCYSIDSAHAGVTSDATGGRSSCMDRYKPVGVLDRGGQALVHLVQHKRDGRLLVAKELRVSGLDREEHRIALEEVKCLQRMDYPNIVGYVEHFEASGALYIITEYADGGTLASAIYGEDRRGAPPMGEDVILRYFTQIAHALHDLHSRHWIHRDVKPANIFLTIGGDVKLGGLGISTVLPDRATAGTFSGSEDYIAPEVLMRKKYDAKVDVWALGIVLYEMLMQCRPFTGQGYQLHNGIVSMPYPAVRTSYTAELRDVLDRCLMKDPVARPDIATLLALPIVRGAMH